MYENIQSKERQIVSNGDVRISKNQFTKSLTSFHTKKGIAKSVYEQNTSKKPEPIKDENSVKNKRVYLSR
jgi:hypothetical protein